MMIGNRLRALRAAKKLSQGDVEKRSGLLRCYVSRVENGHTVPAIDTLEKWARALGIPMYQLFYEGEAPPKIPKDIWRSEEHTSELQSLRHLVCRLLLEKKKNTCKDYI